MLTIVDVRGCAKEAVLDRTQAPDAIVIRICRPRSDSPIPSLGSSDIPAAPSLSGATTGLIDAFGLPQSIFLYNPALGSSRLGNPVDKRQPCQASSRQLHEKL